MDEMRTRHTTTELITPLSVRSEKLKDLLLLDVGPLAPLDVLEDHMVTEPVPVLRKDSGEAHLDYLEITITSLSPYEGGIGNFADVASHRLNGTDISETFWGLNTRDVIDAGDGDDTVYAGDGNDTVYGRDGDDHIELGDGDDMAFGGAGDDIILGGNGNDLLSGGAGNDILFAGDDGWMNILNGGRGHDTMVGSSFDGVTDIFQFTEAEDAPAPGNFDQMDQINGFRDGEDLIWLVFDADGFEPGHQGFEFVAQEAAGQAGTIWLQNNFSIDQGTNSQMTVTLRGHTDNDGQEDFFFKVHMQVDASEVNLLAEDAAYQALSVDDFIFG